LGGGQVYSTGVNESIWHDSLLVVQRTSDIQLLDQLYQLKNQFGPPVSGQVLSLLGRLGRQKIADAKSIIRFHEVLLFLRAYPQNAAMVQATETLLRGIPGRIASLLDEGVDLSALEHPELSGIAGTSVTDTFSYDIVQWLQRRHPSQITLDWEWFEDDNRLAETWPRFMPLLEEDALVEASVPYREWLLAARNGRSEVSWLIDRFKNLPLTGKERAELYNSQKIYVRWTPSYIATRTGLRGPRRATFYHRSPLIGRRDINFTREVKKTPPRFEKLTASQGQAVLDLAREASTARYRELYGFTHGDPKSIFKTYLGRGVDLFVMGLPPERRLPLRAYHSAMIFKNAVPVGYFEGLSLFERMESGFNLYYTFRDGETAWTYARTLNVMHHLTGVKVFSLDPYQLGHENEEGIESGAFWFYRKLGFRSTNQSLLNLTAREEAKIGAGNGYRTPAATLRKLAAAPMVLELDNYHRGDWDNFQIRNIGLKVQRRMAAKFSGDSGRMREATIRLIGKVIGVHTVHWSKGQLRVLGDFAVVLSVVHEEISKWDAGDKGRLAEILKAKSEHDETSFLKLMQAHTNLRRTILKLGSGR
jgi:hypothetical protein